MAVLALSSQHVADAGTCKTLLDSDNTLIKSLAAGYRDDFSEFPFDTVFADLHGAVPWLSKCAAAIDPVAFYASILTSSNFRSCLSKAERTNLDDGLWISDGWEMLCPLLKGTAVPCVKNAMIEIVMDAFSLTGGCCESLLDQVDALFSDSLTTMVEKLTQYVVNIVCSERKYTNLNGKATTELCGYSILKSLDFIAIEADILPLLGLLQLPSAGMCDAFAGETFQLTNGSEFKIGFGMNGANTIGICLEPIDDLLKYVASWPILAQTWNANGAVFSPSDLLATGKYLSFGTLNSWFKTPTNLPAIVRLTLERFAVAVRTFMAARYTDHDHDDGDDSYNQPYNYAGSYNYGKNVGGSSDFSVDVGDSFDHNYSYAVFNDSSYWGGSSWSSASDGGSNLLFVLAKQLIADVDGMKLHFPNDGGCMFSSQSITLPYDVSKSTAVDMAAAAVTTSIQSSGTSLSILHSIFWAVAGLTSSIL